MRNVRVDLFKVASLTKFDLLRVLLTDKAASEPIAFGITFILENSLRTHRERWFDLVDYRVSNY